MRKHAALLVFVAALVFFSVGAASRGLWEADEHRIAEVAREMAAPGGDWIVPHLGGKVYSDKPPLVMWMVAFAHGPLGVDLSLAAKLPSILGGALTVLATFLIARRLYGDTAGIAAAAIVATAAEFNWICRRAQYDPLVAGFTTLAMWFFVRSYFGGPEGERRRPWLDAVAGSLCVGLGVLTKGPVAMVFTAPAILAFVLVVGEGRSLLTPRIASILLALVPVAIWLAATQVVLGVEEGPKFAKAIVEGQAVGHAAGEQDKLKPWWFYLRHFPEDFLPWTLFLPAAVFAATSRRRDVERRADLFVLSWFVMSFVLMSLSPAKRELYLLPLYPAAAIAVARSVTVAGQIPKAAFAVPRVVLGFASLLAGLAAIVVAVLVMSGADGLLAERIAWWTSVRGAQGWAGPVLSIVGGIPLAAFGWRALRSSSGDETMGNLIAASFAGSILFAMVVLPCADPAKSPRRFYEQTAALVGDAPVALCAMDDHAAHWILRRTELLVLPGPRAAAKFLVDQPGPAYVIVERPTLTAKGLPVGARVVFEERLPLEENLVLIAR